MTKVIAEIDGAVTTQYFDKWNEAVSWTIEIAKGVDMVKFKFEKEAQE